LIEDLPVIQVSEDASVLNSLVSLLYHVTPVILGTYERIFALLATCKKYGMVIIETYIRAEVNRGAYPGPVGAEGFRAYAIASKLGLIQEKENAAGLTLRYPMTFESLGEGLREFEGWILCDLIRYRKLHIRPAAYRVPVTPAALGLLSLLLTMNGVLCLQPRKRKVKEVKMERPRSVQETRRLGGYAGDIRGHGLMIDIGPGAIGGLSMCMAMAVFL